MSYILEFENSRGQYREIARFESDPENAEKEAMKHIKVFCDDHNFHIYYTRLSRHKGYTWFDVGSHTEFFHLNRTKE